MSVSIRIEGVLLIRQWPDGNGMATYWCPGCTNAHSISYGGSETWTWDGDTARPTFAPSVLVSSHKTLIDPDLKGDALTAPENITDTPQCHSFVRGGRIEYLSDSTHPLAGQTVDMVALPERFAKFVR